MKGSKNRWLKWIVGAVLFGGTLAGVFLAGAVAEARGDIFRRAGLKISAILGPGSLVEGDRSEAASRTLQTTFHTLRLQRIQLLPLSEPFVMETFHGTLLFATHSGGLGVVDRLSGDESSISIFETRVPMGSDALQSDEIWSNPLFVRSWFRTHDLHVELTSEREGMLYASHHRFSAGCFVLAVSRARLHLDDMDRVRLEDRWEEVFASRPCLTPKKSGDYFAGLQAGGRMVSTSPGTLLLSTGDHQLDGIHGEPAAPMDPDMDYGKIIEINMDTLEQELFAWGFRNPQGLAVASDGTIWETEHGPEGGDELNLVQRGRNYGWPNVTYGMLYGFPVRDWPMSERQGRHDGYTKPSLAFVPSIGISNLVEADSVEFPRWAGDLLISSLRAQALFRARRDGGAVSYTEEIALPAGFRGRIRDLVVLDDGRVAMATDGGELILMGNMEGSEPTARDLNLVHGYDAAGRLLSPFSGETAVSRVEQGRTVFEQSCGACHSLNGVSGAGPDLAGIVGRPVGSLDDFAYSARLSEDDGSWTAELLLSFLSDPDTEFRGTTMERVFLVPDQYRAVVTYLEQVR